MKAHLTSEQMDEALAGRMDRVVAHHVKTCKWCEEEIAALGAALGSVRSSAFETASRERTRAVMPRQTRSVPRLAWVGAVAAMLLAVSTPLTLHRNNVAAVSPAPAAVESASQQISDEALLNSIQGDLASSVPESMTPLTEKESSQSSTQ
jgi:hypothetical protein